MNKQFSINVTFSLNIDYEKLKQKVPSIIYPALKSFIEKLVADPEALKMYYSGYLEEVIFSEHNLVEDIASHLDEKTDHKELFMRVSSECGGEVKTLIEKTCNPPKETDGIINYQQILDLLIEVLDVLAVDAASFDVLPIKAA